MEPGLTLYSTILLLGAAHGLFLALALLNARCGNLVAQRLLAALTLVFAMDVGDEFLYQTHLLKQASFLVAINDPLDFLYGPLTYLYVISLTARTEFKLTGNRWLHFLPCAAGYLLMIPFFTLDTDVKLRLYYEDMDANHLHLALAQIGAAVMGLASMVHIGVYLGLAIRQLRGHIHRIRDQFSYVERISLVWLRNLLIGLCTLYAVYIAAVFLSEPLGFNEELHDLLMSMIVVMMYTMGYLGLRQPAIFSQLEASPADVTIRGHVDTPPEKMESTNRAREKYRKSALDPEMSQALFIELQTVMELEKPYLDGALTLPQLAKHLGISPNYLSQVINEQLGQNFFDFINRYRVEEAKRYLSDPARTRANILTLALDAGFNSKSAFYTAFKKHTSMTPGQFKKSLAVA